MNQYFSAAYTRRNCGVGFLFVVLCSAMLSGCFSSNQYQTAEPLPKGEFSMAYGWGLTQFNEISIKNSETGESETVDADVLPPLPNLIPDVLIRVGLDEDVDFGVKLFLVGIQGDVKWRFFKNDNLSLAIAPTGRYAQPFFIFQELTGELPLIGTVRAGENLAFTASVKPFISQWNVAFGGSGSGEANDALESLNFGGISASGGISLEFGTFWIRPEVTWTQQLIEGSSGAIEFSYFNGGVAFGFIYGREAKRLDKVEDRLDNLENR